MTDLSRTMLWVSHILVGYDGASARVPWSPFTWQIEPSATGRSRAQALELAQELARKAEEQPLLFGELAQRYSDDVTTRARGGSLGGARASDFLGWEHALDVLAALQPGQVSRTFETGQGFFVFHRREAPAPEQVSGARIVIGYDGAEWLRLIGAPPPRRSRAEALALAQRIYGEAVEHPERFTELVERYSDHPDKARGGDFGSWSLREPTPFPREVELLTTLAVTEVGEPLDSAYGVEIIRRTEVTPRPVYAMESIKVVFQPGDAESERAAEKLAGEILREVRQRPEAFVEYQARYCCQEPERWVQGREEPGLTEEVSQLALGDIARRPLRQYLYYLIPKRVDPAEVTATPEPLFELPSPFRPDLKVAAVEQPESLMEALQRATADTIGQHSSLRPEQREALHQQLQELQGTAGTMVSANTALHKFLVSAQQILGPEPYEYLRTAIERQFEQSIIGLGNGAY